LEEALAHLQQLITEEEHFTARALKMAKEQTGVNEEPMAVGCAALLALYLLCGSRAQFIANLLLVTVPLLLTYVFPDERPSMEQLQVHWGCFAASLLLDSLVGDKMTGYYLLKIAFFVCLFLRPFVWADKIIQVISDYVNQHSSTPLSQPLVPEPSTITSVEHNEEPMKDDPRYRLIPSSGDPVAPVNFDDVIFSPRNRLVFNAPQAGVNLECILKMTSNSPRNIAFAFKSTCVDRLSVRPANGILGPREVLRLVVSIPVLELGPEAVVDDRIALDYAFCPLDALVFSFNLLTDGTELRRRKNLHVYYNF